MLIEEMPQIINDVKHSGVLGKSQRPAKLFEYLLQKSLLNEHTSLSQYSIAIDVLERSETFDSAIDSIVRVEMHRLRASLKTYNAGNHAYTITIPPASYQVIVQEKGKGLDAFIPKMSLIQGIFSVLLATFIFFLGLIGPKFYFS